MKGGRRRWLWLLVPIVGIGIALLGSTGDPWSKAFRDGTGIAPETAIGMSMPLYLDETDKGSLPSYDRARAWRLPRSPEDAAARIRARGLRQVYAKTFAPLPGHDPSFFGRYREFYDETTETGVLLIEGTKVPKGSRCVVMVEERMDFPGFWGRFKARFGR